ncbi:putative RRB1 involved in the regulation of ribosome biosynthesis protein [Rutstroemia sp. NJR-2017a BBW]|nr:putative RRB1 involved in the regulation of ribosome biosynthesis protein [Rutstroemia sp. NJR-2017a BBW]
MSDGEDFEVEVPELAEDDPMRAFLPTSFGKKSKEADVAAQINRTKRALHDFASMTPTTLRAFKSVDPNFSKSSTNSETHPINHVEFNPHAGGTFLCVSAHPQAKIMNRDGEVIGEFIKGDMYLRDMHNTKGHVSEVTTGTWSPTDKNICVTAGTDSTLRIWDVNVRRAQKDIIVHKSKASGSAGRTRMTAVVWGGPAQGGNNLLVSAALDGSLVMWSGNGPYARPAAEIRDAHTPDTWTGGIDISPDGRMVVTRGGDNLIKLWDTRKFKSPILTVSHPSTSDHYSVTNIKYSPNGSNIITGSASGHLHILNSGNLKPELVTPVTPGSPLIAVQWHPKLNQIITASANSEVHVLYNPNKSTRGAVDVMSRGVLGSNSSTSFAARHPTVGLTASGRSRDPRRPQMPLVTPFAKSQPDEKHINESITLSSMRDEDPREALLKYAEKAKNDPIFTYAYQQTQPVTQYANLSDDEEDGPDKKKVKR